MELTQQIITIAAVLLGTFFSVVGIIGLIRFPDVYTRLHATGKVGVFGVVLLLVAAATYTPLGWGKALVLIVLLMVSGPVTAHAIASAAYRLHIPMKDAIQDYLVEQDQQPTHLKSEKTER